MTNPPQAPGPDPSQPDPEQPDLVQPHPQQADLQHANPQHTDPQQAYVQQQAYPQQQFPPQYGPAGYPASVPPRNRTPLIVVGLLVVAALIGGGVWLGLSLTGDDDNDSSGSDATEVAAAYAESVLAYSPEDSGYFERARALTCEGSEARKTFGEGEEESAADKGQPRTTISVQQPITTAIVREEPGVETVVRVSAAVTAHSNINPSPVTSHFMLDITVAEHQPRCVSKVEPVIGTS